MEMFQRLATYWLLAVAVAVADTIRALQSENMTGKMEHLEAEEVLMLEILLVVFVKEEREHLEKEMMEVMDLMEVAQTVLVVVAVPGLKVVMGWVQLLLHKVVQVVQD